MRIDGWEEYLALGLTFAVHVIGAAVLVWGMVDSEQPGGGWRGWWPRDDDLPGPEPGDGPPSSGERPPLPLPRTGRVRQSRVRLREPGRAAERLPRPGRRPEHPPERAPERVALGRAPDRVR